MAGAGQAWLDPLPAGRKIRIFNLHAKIFRGPEVKNPDRLTGFKCQNEGK